MTARIFQLAISNGGVPKHAIRQGTVTELGLAGDRQKHTKIHGGPLRALCLFSVELIEKLQAEGHPIYPGSVGENVTLSGLDWASLRAGTQLALGDQVVVELTWEAEPCRTIRESFVGGNIKRQGVPGEMRWYCKVLTPGHVRVGQPVHVIA